MNSFFFKKKILITGASYGLGSVVANTLAVLGAELIITARSHDKLTKVLNNLKNKSRHSLIVSDLQSNKSIKEMCDNIIKHFDKVDIIMHIAGGGLGVKGPVPSSDDYMKVLKLNLLSVLEINRHLIPLMRKNKSSTIFHVGSIASNESIGSLTYNISKTALVAYVRSLAKELSGTGIVVNGISPGAFVCEGNAMERLKQRNIKAYNEFVNTKIPNRKMSSASDFIDIILMLISEKNYIFNGNMISCDNGEGNFYKTF
jgi:3-oxoacyl-[acyl-carrier protein] reductase